MRCEVPIREVRAQAYTVPTDRPEADGTIAWNSTTLVLVEVEGGGKIGLGYTYSAACIVALIREKLAAEIKGKDALSPEACFHAMQRVVRNLGREGLAATAISAIDTALHDLKARLLDLPLVSLLGVRRSSIPIYGSGGFTTYSDGELENQLGGWVNEQGCEFVKMKVGSQPERDPRRVTVAKRAIGEATLFVDANGAFGRKQAIEMANRFRRAGRGLVRRTRIVRRSAGIGHGSAPRACRNGDRGRRVCLYDSIMCGRMLAAGAVDVQQADATRCGGFTGFLQIAALCDAFHIDLSGHCAPALHLHVACAAPRLRHLEWFHDHVRIEQMLFDGAPAAARREIRARSVARRDKGLTFKQNDAARYAEAA